MQTRTAAKPESTRLVTPVRSLTPTRSPLLQRKCACGNSASMTGQCSGCEQKKLLQRRSSEQTEVTEVPPIVHEVLRSPGQPLETETQTLMQSRLGHDLKSVRVHTDGTAAASAQAVNAEAYTVGDRIVFGAGHYAPRTSLGQRLITHELIHVLQQRSLPTHVSGSLKIGRADDGLERQADQMANQTTDRAQPAGVASSVNSAQPSLQRQRLRTVPGISTPQPANTRVRRDGSISYQVNGVRVTFLPDMDDPSIGHKAETTIHFNDFAIDAQTRGDRVSSFTGPGAVEATIQTTYGMGLSASSTSGYGRGTTTADRASGHTSLGFHEGRHGLDYVEFIRQHRFPRFSGRRGMSAEAFQQAMESYSTAREQYQQALDRFSAERTDCVGTPTIDDFNHSRGVTSSICQPIP